MYTWMSAASPASTQPAMTMMGSFGLRAFSPDPIPAANAQRGRCEPQSPRRLVSPSFLTGSPVVHRAQERQR
jgi:hypothetical protein